MTRTVLGSRKMFGTRDVAQLVEYLLALGKHWVWFPASHKPGKRACTCDSSTCEVETEGSSSKSPRLSNKSSRSTWDGSQNKWQIARWPSGERCFLQELNNLSWLHGIQQASKSRTNSNTCPYLHTDATAWAPNKNTSDTHNKNFSN